MFTREEVIYDFAGSAPDGCDILRGNSRADELLPSNFDIFVPLHEVKRDFGVFTDSSLWAELCFEAQDRIFEYYGTEYLAVYAK